MRLPLPHISITDGISRKVLKVMGIFTSVEMVGILCSMVKMKLVALWLDAVGVGLFNIFNTTIETTTYLTGLGVRQSAVRDVSLASHGPLDKLRALIESVRGWSVVAGILGAVALASLAFPLAEIIFGDGGMWWNFLLLAGAMLLNALYAGESAIFQGTEQFKRLARTGFEMAVVGLLISIPMFRFMGNASVAWSLLVYSFCGVIFAFLNRDRRFPYRPARVERMRSHGKFIKFGAYIAITAFLNSLCQLAFATWLNRVASTAEVGFYAAGYTLVVRYTSLVFNSVGLEFYPRVAACLNKPRRMEIFLNHEVMLLLLLFTPLMLLFMIFREAIVLLLYRQDFLIILPYITWGIVTVLLRAVSNSMAYTIMARGEGKVYMLTDTADAIIGLCLSIWLYSEFGLLGIGIAMVIWHSLYLLIVECVCRIRYGLRLSREACRVMLTSMLTAIGAIASIFYLPAIAYVSLMVVGVGIYCWLFVRFLRRRRKSRGPLSQARQ